MKTTVQTWALSFFLFAAIVASAAPSSANIVASASTQEFINLDTSDLTIDCGDLGGPGFSGQFISTDEAGMEVHANVPMRVTYASESGLHNGVGELPTWVQTSAQGKGQLGGVTFFSPNDFTPYGALPLYKLGDPMGTVVFDRYALSSETAPNSVKKGFKIRLVALRNGLSDPGGHYNAQIVVTWSRL